MRCAACYGPYHPATGHMLTSTMVLCGPCARDFCAWLKRRMAQMDHGTKKSKGAAFSTAAALSIHGD